MTKAENQSPEDCKNSEPSEHIPIGPERGAGDKPTTARSPIDRIDCINLGDADWITTSRAALAYGVSEDQFWSACHATDFEDFQVVECPCGHMTEFWPVVWVEHEAAEYLHAAKLIGSHGIATEPDSATLAVDI